MPRRDPDLDRALRAYANGDLAEARRLAEAILARSPEDDDALALLDDIVLLDATEESRSDAAAPVAAGYTTDALSPSSAGPADPAAEEARRLDERPGFGDLRADDRWKRAPAPGASAPPPVAPLGVLVLAALHAVAGVVAAIVGLILLTSGSDAAAGLGLLLVILAVASFGIARGLWNLREWAWLAAVALEILSILRGAVQLADGNALGVLTLGVGVLVLAYLVRVRGHFGGAAQARPPRGRAPSEP